MAPCPGPFQPLSTQDELMTLKCALEKYLPLTSQILNVVKMKLQGLFSEETRVDFYIYEDSWDDPFVLCLQQPNIHGLYCILLRAPDNTKIVPEMMSAFESFVDWSQIDVFAAVDQDFFDNGLGALCLKYGGMDKEDGHPCYAHHLLPEDIIEETKEDNIELRRLSISDVDQVLENYGTWAHPQSRRQVTLAIQSSPSCGLYVDGELASYALLSPVGLFNILYTEEGFRKRGFGVMVLQKLASMAVAQGFTPMAEAKCWNAPARMVQLKAGFKLLNMTNWVVFNRGHHENE